MCSLVAWDVRSCSFPLAGFLSITTEALFVASAIRVYDTIMNRERDTHYAPSTVDIAATSKKCSFPGVITIQPDIGTDLVESLILSHIHLSGTMLSVRTVS